MEKVTTSRVTRLQGAKESRCSEESDGSDFMNSSVRLVSGSAPKPCQFSTILDHNVDLRSSY
jgi:hypothetical protein